MSIDEAEERTAERQAERDLFRQLRGADGAERERIQHELVSRYTGMVQWLVSRYANSAVDRDDLEQVGFLGLVLAIQRFDPDRGHDFISFARPTVQGEIRRYFRDKRRWIRLPRRLQETKAVLGAATETLTHRLGRAPTVAELSAELAVDEELVLEAMTADDAFSPQSLETPLASDSGEAWTLADVLGAPEPCFELIDMCHSLAPLIAALPERDRRILEMRFVRDMTQAEIGAELGYSQMHISRLITATLGQLRAQFATA